MIKIFCDNEKILPEIIHYPDGTMKINLDDTALFNCSEQITIVWKYENEAELVKLIYITKHIREHYPFALNLFLPYLPNARMDRVKTPDEVFTLKYFCDMINSLNFNTVKVIDVHSSVGEALLNKVQCISAYSFIYRTIELIGFDTENDYIFFPDEGSCKRYTEIFKNFRHIGFGIKNRDWKTGKILGLDIHGESPQGRRILIIDDICSYGGTVYHSAMKLKELGGGDIYAYFTHCENSIAKGELLKGNLIKHIYTTNSLINLNPDNYQNKITVIDCGINN